ncbi:krev interaction trapped protein 1-like isoform X4 [Physella acuta]|uniref:krev interaction trapped protein 1-like isoform X4 n=1 Tax=Physella acuta TaxID=109671 RepID=UPI0027DB4F49|nr:krev interaction trapped protein 1-like isoform X4 [Physella acuta]
MDIVVAVIKPAKPGHATMTYRPQLYEILLLDSKMPPGEKGKQSKYLPMMTIKSMDEEPRELVLTQVHNLTGIKGERALLVQWNNSLHSAHRESLARFSLYFVPVSLNAEVVKKVTDPAQTPPSFYPLEYVIHTVNHNSIHFPSPTRTFLLQLESWLEEKHQRQTAIEFMFQQRADYRIHFTVHNPVFIHSRLSVDVDSGSNGKTGNVPQEIVKTANEALAKMLAIEKCNTVVINPLFGSALPYKTKPNTYVINQHWPNMPSVHVSNNSTGSRWQDRYPLHNYAAQGEKRTVELLLRQGYSPSVLDNVGCAPIHYAARYGHVNVVEALLFAGCSPNLVDVEKNTALHTAAKRGHVQLAKCLLQCPDIDLSIKDKDGNRAVDICATVLDKTVKHEEVEKLIKEAAKRPSFTVAVFLMDKSSKNLKLISGFKTTVQQLNEQLMKEFNLPQNYSDIFTLWIGSKSLELQLKLESEVVKELQQWYTRCVNMLTSRRNPSDEEPILTWRRNVKVSVEKEKQLQHPKALDLLFYEARHNYRSGLYPCGDKDTISFATIIFSLQHWGATNIKSILSNLNHPQLVELMPAVPIKPKDTRHWVNKISIEYGAIKDLSKQQLKSQFLSACQRLTVYGSAFFTGTISSQSKRSSSSNTHCYVGVNDIGIHIISVQTKQMIQSLKYKLLFPLANDPVTEIQTFVSPSK